MRILIAFFLFACGIAHADIFGQFNLGTTGPAPTNTVAALATNSISSAAVEVPLPPTVGSLPIWVYYNASNAVNGSITFTFVGSADGTNYISARTNGFNLNCITSGLSNVVSSSINVANCRWLKLTGIEDTNTYSISNIFVSFYAK